MSTSDRDVHWPDDAPDAGSTPGDDLGREQQATDGEGGPTGEDLMRALEGLDAVVAMLRRAFHLPERLGGRPDEGVADAGTQQDRPDG